MEHYDPEVPPDPEEWMALDEGERHILVEDFHESMRNELPNPTLHAAMHVVVENQVAIGAELPVAGHLSRLLTEGLSRHEAIHAIASVLSEHMFNLVKSPPESSRDPHEAYYQALARLSAGEWRDS